MGNAGESVAALVSGFEARTRELRRGSRYLAGVSGGADSVAMLYLLAEAGFRKLVVCHLDHGLRGRRSAADAGFVKRLAEQLGLEFRMEKVAVRREAKRAGMSLEEAGRQCRHAFFAEVAQETKCRRIFLGHHADDRAETLLFNLLRGTGTQGLGALREAVTIYIGGRRMEILRPLLEFRRGTLREYLSARALSFREDASNADPAFTRNRIRSEILPYLSEKFGRDAGESLVKAAAIVSAENDFLDKLVSLEVVGSELSVKDLGRMHVAIQRRVIQSWLRRAGVGGVGFKEVESVRGLMDMDSRKPAKINLPGDRHARRRAGKIFLE